MSKSTTIEKILAEIKELDETSRQYLLEQIQKLRIEKSGRTKASGKPTTSQLHSLGSDIWKGVDVSEYLQQERQWD